MKRIILELAYGIQAVALLTALPGVLISGLIDRLLGKDQPSKWRLP